MIKALGKISQTDKEYIQEIFTAKILLSGDIFNTLLLRLGTWQGYHSCYSTLSMEG